MTEHLKFPIGPYQKPEVWSDAVLKQYIHEIASFPGRLKEAVDKLSDEKLDTPYRNEGWTIRQVVHHCADSHLNSFIRFKLALTEDNPTIKPYSESLWANLADSQFMPIAPSLSIIDGVHERWTTLLNNLSQAQLERTFVHPEQDRIIRLDENIGIYAWHGNHHLAHITSLKTRMGWK